MFSTFAALVSFSKKLVKITQVSILSISIYRILENIDIDKDNLAILEYIDIDIGNGICKNIILIEYCMD